MSGSNAEKADEENGRRNWPPVDIIKFFESAGKEKKRYKEKVLGDIYNDTHNYRLVVVQHQDFQQKETSSSTDCCCTRSLSFAHVDSGAASCVDLYVRRP